MTKRVDGRSEFPEVGQVYRMQMKGFGAAVARTPMIRVRSTWTAENGNRHISYTENVNASFTDPDIVDVKVQLAGYGWYRLFTPVVEYQGVRLIDVSD